MAELHTGLSAAPLDVAALIGDSPPGSGGTAVFVGTVRRSSAARPGQEVVALDYDAHPELAGRELERIAGEAAARFSLERVVAVHRTGRCALGEPTVVVVCNAPHRAEALEACRWLIDTLKQTVPIWKKELYDDGSAWVGAAG